MAPLLSTTMTSSGDSPSTLLDTNATIPSTCDVRSFRPDRGLIITEAVGFVCSSVKSDWRGMTMWTLLCWTSSRPLMVRASSPWSAR
jgi:hypothetical protein